MTELIIPRTRISFRETTYALNTLCLETPESWKHGGIVEKLKKKTNNIIRCLLNHTENLEAQDKIHNATISMVM